MSDFNAETGVPERGPCAHRVRFKLDFPYYQALRDAKRQLNRTDDLIWRWRYVLATAISCATLFFYTRQEGFTSGQMLTREFLLSLGSVGIAMPLLIFMVDLFFDKVLARWIFHRSSMSEQTLTLELHETKIAWKAEGIAGELAWSRILRLIVLADYLFLFFGKMEGLGIPKAATSEQQFSDIVRYAKERVNG